MQKILTTTDAKIKSSMSVEEHSNISTTLFDIITQLRQTYLGLSKSEDTNHLRKCSLPFFNNKNNYKFFEKINSQTALQSLE